MKANLLSNILSVVGRFLALLLTLILSIPVLLLPAATAVPAWAWIPLAAADVALFSMFFWLKPAWKGVAISLGGVFLVGVLAVVVSQAFAMTPPILGADGKPVPGSIATLEKVTLNGSRQWISIRGKDTHKPVLLFLAGGPGGSQLATERYALGGLEDHFVVVNWEQPGAGKSFDAVNRSTLTPERYIEDAHALVALLKERFGQEKVYVLGESWGSALGIMLVQRYPEDFHAFIGTGQMVAFLENDLMCYEFALDWARQRGDAKKVEKLLKQGPPPYYGKGMSLKEATYLLDTFTFMNANPAITDNGFSTWRDLAAPEYGLYDKVSWFRGVIETLDVVYPQLWDVDFRQQATKLDVPVYFFIGRHDINAPVVLTEQYYERLDAPHKQIVWFEHSGHTPWVSESDRFVQAMVDTVLAQTPAPTLQTPTPVTPTAEASSSDIVLNLSDVAQEQSVETVAAVPPSADAPYWNAAPQHGRVTLQGYPVTGHLFQPQIFIYPAADFVGVNETAVRTITALQNLLQARQPVERMPFLPLTNEVQALHVQVQYLNFQDGQGVRFLTQLNQGPTPINNVQLIYTFQGLTADGKYYIAAVLPVTHPELPVNAQQADNVSDFPAYMAQTVVWLDQQPADSFTPDLTKLDALIQSIAVK